MTGKLNILAAMLADDVRFELGGAVSLMGVVPDGLLEAIEFPLRRRLAVLGIFDIVETGDVVLETSISLNGEVKWKIEHEIQLTESGLNLVFPIGATTALFDQPGELELSIGVKDEAPQYSRKWPVRLPESAVDNADENG